MSVVCLVCSTRAGVDLIVDRQSASHKLARISVVRGLSTLSAMRTAEEGIAYFDSVFFAARLLVRFAAIGRGRGRGTSSALISTASVSSGDGAALSACAGGGSRISHWQSL